MIYYDSNNLLEILFRWHGSALNGPAPVRALLMAIFALIVAVVNHSHPFVVPTRESTAFVDTLTVFNTFIGLMVSFRMNSAFQQWRSGVVAVGALSEAARGIVSSGCAYVSATVPQPPSSPASDSSTTSDEEVRSHTIPRDIMEKCTFFTELRRLVFLYIAIVFHDCRGRDGIDTMKDAAILTESEYDELYACGSERPKKIVDKESYYAVVQRTPHKLRATVVELWLKRLVEVATQRGHLSSVNANMLQLKISQLPALYTTVFNIANVPIPFNYMQYLQLLIAAYMTLYTFVIVPRSGLYSPLWVFFWGMFLFTADQVAMEIECPFGLDANDIDLEARLLQIEEELTVLVRSQYYFVSGGKLLSSTLTISGRKVTTWEEAPFSHKKTHSSRATSGHKSPGPILESFSFHQGRTTEEHARLVPQESLPEINEYTGLITQIKSDGYGSQSSSSNTNSVV
ncbi:hypothetical protein Poli38472_004105 [Pythium oligandrum]|uniref:Uncharacterized protein n=1 Tax=Pythium oligandrum TaxID=41045 RepID=A0A8K1CN22_PYTOL|nr:hypothetical protein Poli38472_004105 [Pythium oligandrum]|eukprot:TMW66340.1 hypothetical protein Poli38472_004105 [Pythium oligandrum]